jgi:hypothetical protein
MQWKNELRKAMRVYGHRLYPITRVSAKLKNYALAELSNQYETGCRDCILRIKSDTAPGVQVSHTYYVGSRILTFEEGSHDRIPLCTRKHLLGGEVQNAKN